MKVQVLENDKIVLYLYNYFFKSTEKDIITRKIKEIFLKLIKYYNINMGGVYNVLVYENSIYGTVLEIEKTSELLFNPDLIDIKVKMYKNVDFYFKTPDYFILKSYQNVYYENNNYYINLKDLDNLVSFLEFGTIDYVVDTSYLKKKIFIQWYLFLNIQI